MSQLHQPIGKLGQDASIDWAIGVMNEGNVVADFDSDLAGNGSHADLKVAALSSGRQGARNWHTCDLTLR